MTTDALPVVDEDTEDLTKPFLTDKETEKYRHVNSDYGLAIALGMRNMKVYEGTFNEGKYYKRRAKNKVARKSRAVNRKKR